MTKPDPWYEFTRDVKSLGGDSLDVRVRFFYEVDEKTISKRFNFTVHAENEDELEERIESCWEQYKPSSPAEALAERLRGKKKVR